MDISAHNCVLLKNLEEYQMIEDSIVEEVRRYRKEHAAQYGNDLKRIVEALREKERLSKNTLLNPGPRMILKKTGS